MFKITKATTKTDLSNALVANLPLVEKQDKTLAEQIVYAGKNPDKATRKDLVDLVKEVMQTLGNKFIVPAAAQEKTEKPKTENLVKRPAPKKTEDTSEDDETDEDETEDTEDEVEEEPKSKTKKSGKTAKKPDKKGAVTALEDTNNPKAVQLAKQFPETITVDGEKYEVAHDVKTIADLASEDDEFEFAFYWTKRHLRQFPYFNDWLGHPKSFPDDLDTCQLIYVSDDSKVAYAVSDTTEAVYSIFPNDLEEVDGLRIAAGIEFQIYRKVKSEDTEDDAE